MASNSRFFSLLHKGILSLMLSAFAISISFAQQQPWQIPPPGQFPLEIEVKVRVNKIYDINSVNETYKVDGYLVYSWKDSRMEWTPLDTIPDLKIYENDHATELQNNGLWVPALEMINVQGNRETANKLIEISPDGLVNYEERFFATFKSEMKYRPFPFDTQDYILMLEPFSYDEHQLKFIKADLFPKLGEHRHLGEDWEVLSQGASISSTPYDYFDDSHADISHYSRASFFIRAQRIPGYYIWQVLFPLLIIIMASFSIFWIKEFGAQIGVGFTLMLTVVAFNFYSASILPKLSYNTFIEYVIIVGYIFIFLGIVAVIVNHRINGEEKKKTPKNLLNYLRFGFPLAYVLIMLGLYYFKVVNYY